MNLVCCFQCICPSAYYTGRGIIHGEHFALEKRFAYFRGGDVGVGGRVGVVYIWMVGYSL